MNWRNCKVYQLALIEQRLLDQLAIEAVEAMTRKTEEGDRDGALRAAEVADRTIVRAREFAVAVSGLERCLSFFGSENATGISIVTPPDGTPVEWIQEGLEELDVATIVG